MVKSTLLLILLLFSVYGQTQSQIESALSELPNLNYEKLDKGRKNEVYTLKIRQPLDHSDTTKGFFNQKVYLSHSSFETPMVIVTAGYNVNRNYTTELSKLLKSNQIIVEHRYFGESMPDSLDYHYLNLEQATADLHHIRQLLAPVYSGKWISTGVSKGGVTTIFYKYFYPNDVEVSVPYVAPINKSYEEQRIYKFLDTVGSDECRNKIKDFQTLVLKNREKLMPLLNRYNKEVNASYTYLTFGEAFEYAVMEYPFSFWQWGSNCNEIPSNNSTIEEISAYFISVSDPTFFSDNAIKNYGSHYYQSATEMGYYGYETSEFKDYLIDIPTDSNPMALFYPFEMTEQFNPQLLEHLNLWLETKGDKFIYIYGGSDTWSASAVPYNPNVDSEWFMMKGKHHGNARVKYMTKDDQKRFISTLEEWLSLKIK